MLPQNDVTEGEGDIVFAVCLCSCHSVFACVFWTQANTSWDIEVLIISQKIMVSVHSP